MKTLERQLGARKIELDTRAGWAEFDVPAKIDVDQIVAAMVAASYTLERIDFVVEGPIIQEGDAIALEVSKTGQKLPLEGGKPAAAGKHRVTAKGWSLEPSEKPSAVYFEPAKPVVKTYDR